MMRATGPLGSISPLVDSIGKAAAFGGLIGAVCGCVTLLVVRRACPDVHLMTFSVICMGGVVGVLVGYCVGIYRGRRSLRHASGKDWLQTLFLGAITVGLIIGAATEVRDMAWESNFVEQVRAVSERDVVEITVMTPAPNIRPLVTLSKSGSLRDFTGKFAAAELYHASHDEHLAEGRVRLLLKDGPPWELGWYVPKTRPADAILGARARVPGLGPLLLDLAREAQPGANTP